MHKWKCFICEKELNNVDERAIAQCYGAGEIQISFHFGSKFDHIVFSNQAKMPQENWESVPSQEMLESTNRAHRLAGCNRIIGQICDECFEKRQSFFRGFEEKKDIKLNLVVDHDS